MDKNNKNNENKILIHSKQGSNDGKNTLDDMIKKLQENVNKSKTQKRKED